MSRPYARFAELADALPTLPGHTARSQALHATFRATSRELAQRKALKALVAHVCGDAYRDSTMTRAGERGRTTRYGA